MKNPYLIRLALVGLLFGMSTAGLAAAKVVSCDTYNNADATLWARLVSGAERQTFDVVVKAPPGRTAEIRRTVNVIVGMRRVGALTISRNASGRLTGSLSFDSTSTPEYRNPGSAPFPVNWPSIGQGTRVRVGNMSCVLKG